MELAGRLGIKYYAFISQVETGFSRVPTEKIEAWANAVGADPPLFAKQLLSFYEPELHRVSVRIVARRMIPKSVNRFRTR